MNNRKELEDKIIEYIRENRVSTTEVADCLGKTGVLPNVLPINKRMFKVGRVKWVYAYNESNWDVHEQIQNIQKGNIIFIEAFNCGDRAIIGDLVSKYLLLYKQSEAIISNAKMRDAHTLVKENYPIWCTGVSPVGCFNTKNEIGFDTELEKLHRDMYDGTIAVCDDSGVVIIPKEQISEEFYEKLKFMEQQEDIWFECIDQRKWNTFETVCLKKYLDK